MGADANLALNGTEGLSEGGIDQLCCAVRLMDGHHRVKAVCGDSCQQRQLQRQLPDSVFLMYLVSD